MLSNDNTEYPGEYEILLPPNCDLIVRKLKYINNETIDNRKYFKNPYYSNNNHVLIIECDYKEPEIIYDLDNKVVYQKPRPTLSSGGGEYKSTKKNKTSRKISRNKASRKISRNKASRKISRNKASRKISRNKASRKISRNKASRKISRNKASRKISRNKTSKIKQKGGIKISKSSTSNPLPGMLSLSKMYQSDLNLQKNNSTNNINVEQNVGQSVEPQLINYSELYKGFSSTSINLLNMSNKFNESDIFEDKEFCQEYSKILEM